jgi:hypothetical protein
VALLTAFVAGACALAAAASAPASTPAPFTLPFAALSNCEAMTHRPAQAPDVAAARAQLSMPAGWHTIRVPADVGSGQVCTAPYLLSDRPGDANLCLELTASASAAENTSGRSLAVYLSGGATVVGQGALPAVAGMHGLWEELEIGMVADSAYAVEAAYESAASGRVYEVALGPTQPPDAGCPRGSSARSRAFARQVAESFRVTLTR